MKEQQIDLISRVEEDPRRVTKMRKTIMNEKQMVSTQIKEKNTKNINTQPTMTIKKKTT